MIVLSSKLIGNSVMNLHLQTEMAKVSAVVIDPEDLRIIAFKVAGPLISPEDGNYLLTEDIRENSKIGFIVDSADVLVNAEDIIRLDDVLKLDFKLIGLKVETSNGKKLGVVSDFTTTEDFVVFQLIVRTSGFKAINHPELTISRKKIKEVTDYKIIVLEETETVLAKESAGAKVPDFIPNYVNPFRKPPQPSVEPESIQTPDE